jgi:hypothetical protein
MNKVRTFAAALLASWGMISDYTFPRSVLKHFKMQIPSRIVLFCFPLAGVFAALLALLPAWLATALFNRFAGALIFTFLGALLLFFKDSGRGVALLVSYITSRISGAPPSIALQRCDSRLSSVLKNPVVILLTGIGIIAVLGMLFALFYRGAGLWLTAVCAADAMVQGRLCLEPDRNGMIPFIRSGESGKNYLAAGALITGVLLLCVFPKIAALGLMVVMWVWFWRELPGIEEFSDGLSSDWITMCGFWGALVTLLCGMGLL